MRSKNVQVLIKKQVFFNKVKFRFNSWKVKKETCILTYRELKIGGNQNAEN